MAGNYHPYSAWIDKLLACLDTTVEDIKEGRMEQDWLLIPAPDKALSESEVAELFAVVRQWLLHGLDPAQPTGSLRRRLKELDGLSSLPLLFAMRQVAYLFGASRRYWPHFREHLLGNKVDIQSVYFLAQDLAQLWFRFYRFSRRTMFFPTEGAVNIKWPTTHAGLLVPHIRLLERFGRALKTEADGQHHPLFNAEIDEFQIELLDWLDRVGEGHSDLAKRLDHAELGLATAVLARRELTQRWKALSPDEESDELSRLKPIRPRLRFDATKERLELVLPEGEWKGYVPEVRVVFGDKTLTWHTAYDSRRDISFARHLVFPVESPSWPNRITVNHGEKAFPVLHSPFDGERGGLLFDAATGWRVRTWQPDEAFYLIIPEISLAQPWLKALFAEVQVLCQPAGDWGGYKVLWVKSRALLQSLDPDAQAGELEELSDQLQAAGAALSLPNLHELTRPRLRPTVGLPAGRVEDKEPEFLVTHPPAFEVLGLWSSPMSCDLERWDSQQQCYQAVKSTNITCLPNQGPVLVIPFNHDAIEGRYQVRLQQDNRFRFALVQPPSSSGGTYELGLQFYVDNDLEDGLVHNLQRIKQGKMIVQAWPGANITFHIEGRTSLALSLSANESGRIFVPLADTVADVERTSFRCFVSHGPVHSDEHRFVLTQYVPDATCRWIGPRLVVQGTVMGPEAVTYAQVIVLGPEPWQGSQIWSQTVPVQPGGRIEASVEVHPTQARWLLICAPGAPSQLDDGNLVWCSLRIESGHQWQPQWRLGNLEAWDRWGPIADWLANQGIPLTDLREAVVLSRMVHFARVLARDTALLRPSIRSIPSRLRTDLTPMLRGTRPPLVTLLPSGVVLPLELPRGYDHAIPPGIVLEPDQALAVLTGNLPEHGVPVSVTEQHRSATVVVKLNNTRYSLITTNSLVYCNSCNRFAPQSALLTHNSCKSFRQLHAGMETTVCLALLWDPRSIAQALVGILERLFLDGDIEGMAEEFGQWLDSVADFYTPSSGVTGQLAWLERVSLLAAAMAELAVYPVVKCGDRKFMGLAPDFSRNQRAAEYLLNKILDWAQ